jgi:hypothetical protein
MKITRSRKSHGTVPLSLLYLNFLPTSFLFFKWCLLWRIKHRSSIGLEIRQQSAFTALRVPLPTATYKYSALQRTNAENWKHSQIRNCTATVMCLWAIYIFPPSICLFCCRKYVDRSREYINCSQTHECRNWDWGRAIPRKGMHQWDLPCSVLCNLARCISPLQTIM